MNARISFQNKMSKKQQETVRELMQEQFRKEAEGHTRRLLKIVCIALNEAEGFGIQRIARFMDAVTKISDEHMTDIVFWTHVDRMLKQMGVPFIPEDYEELERW
jgi:hypothetical protein